MPAAQIKGFLSPGDCADHPCAPQTKLLKSYRAVKDSKAISAYLDVFSYTYPIGSLLIGYGEGITA